MGRGDEHELMPSEAELAEAEAGTRLLLTRRGEPALVAPPPGLSARVLAALPEPGRPRASRSTGMLWARVAVAWAAAAVALLLVFGAWGVLGDSLGPARVAGGPDSSLGELTFTLTLAAKPLVNLLAGSGIYVALAGVAILVGAWLWWRLARDVPFGEVVR